MNFPFFKFPSKRIFRLNFIFLPSLIIQYLQNCLIIYFLQNSGGNSSSVHDVARLLIIYRSSVNFCYVIVRKEEVPMNSRKRDLIAFLRFAPLNCLDDKLDNIHFFGD